MTPTRDDNVAQSSSDAEPGAAAGFEDTEDEDWASAADHRSSPDQGGGPSTSRSALPSARSRLIAEEGELYPTRSATPPIDAETAYRTSQPGRRPDPADRGTVPPSRAHSLHARNRRANDPVSPLEDFHMRSFLMHIFPPHSGVIGYQLSFQALYPTVINNQPQNHECRVLGPRSALKRWRLRPRPHHYLHLRWPNSACH